MDYFLSLAKIILLLAFLAGISYFLVKKSQKSTKFKKSENGQLIVKDALPLSRDTRAVILEVNGKEYLTILSPHAIKTMDLQKNASFSERLREREQVHEES
ncbi:flagellar motor switch protein FliN [Listeria costaricensis]|uniref:flagellar motor switch protein FliN n=1 Tax=Listeria costaricensis TaxID=2026604 RepID=UPI000C084937|nr:flagellar motor switch protein FliN [Listeria costaricensis]